MIQRIQSIYLLGGALLLAWVAGLGDVWTVLVATVHTALPWAVYGLSALGGLIGFLAVFLYKNRAMQLRIVAVAQWLTLALILVLVGCFGMLSFGREDGIPAFDAMTYVSLLLPVVAYVLFSLASRAVRKDIELVRSVDRLR